MNFGFHVTYFQDSIAVQTAAAPFDIAKEKGEGDSTGKFFNPEPEDPVAKERRSQVVEVCVLEA